MCSNPLAHPEMTGGQPLARRGLSQGTTLCGKHNAALPTLEDALEYMGIPVTTVVIGLPPERVCTDCTHIRSRLN